MLLLPCLEQSILLSEVWITSKRDLPLFLNGKVSGSADGRGLSKKRGIREAPLGAIEALLVEGGVSGVSGISRLCIISPASPLPLTH